VPELRAFTKYIKYKIKIKSIGTRVPVMMALLFERVWRILDCSEN
jgi:hypothetical protein